MAIRVGSDKVKKFKPPYEKIGARFALFRRKQKKAAEAAFLL
jgi:hypothetical protein